MTPFAAQGWSHGPRMELRVQPFGRGAPGEPPVEQCTKYTWFSIAREAAQWRTRQKPCSVKVYEGHRMISAPCSARLEETSGISAS